MGDKRQIFISYSHQDREWLDRLMPFLQALVREDQLQVWSDTDIQLSSDWRADIQKALGEADAAILLISQNFLASEFIASNELPQLLRARAERGLRIFPIYVSSCYLKPDSPLRQFQAPNSPSAPLDTVDQAQQNAILARLAKSIDEVLVRLQVGVTEEWLEKFRSRFVPIVGGTFVIGDNELHAQLKALEERTIPVKSFSLGQYVVTQAEWIALMNTQPWANEKNVNYGDDNPAVFVTWGDAFNFVGKLNKADQRFDYRLPTEAEWEYAARGGQQVSPVSRTKYSFGDDEHRLIEYGWHDRNASSLGENYAHPVGMLKPNPLGLFDMHGNIWEWTSDGDQVSRVVHGGGFNAEAKAASSAFRLEIKPEMKGEALGFRLVREPKLSNSLA